MSHDALRNGAGKAQDRVTRQTPGDVEQAHHAAGNQIEQLQAQTRLLQIIAGSTDVRLVLHELASRIGGIVPCDRIGLALLLEDGQFQSYSARVSSPERRTRPRPDVIFEAERTIVDDAVRSQQPVILDDIPRSAPDQSGSKASVNAGFRSALVLPLVTWGRAVGTLNVVARGPRAFNHTQIVPLQPIAELLAVAWLAQQLHVTAGKYRTMEAMAELTLSLASEINGALQTIVGHCGLLERQGLEPAVQRSVAGIVSQAHRIAAMLERMRHAADDRRREATLSNRVGTPSPPGTP